MLYQYVQGARVPALGFGTYRLVGNDCRAGVEHALQIGYRHIDTAVTYMNETEVGQALLASGVPRGDIFLTTKLGTDQLDAEGVRRGTHESLERLQTDHVNLLLIHWPTDEVPLEETLHAMFALRDEGLTRHVGVSNFPSRLLRRARELGPIFCNQVEYHPFLSQATVLAEAREHDVLVTAYSPIARGKVNDDPVLQEIGERYGKTPVQVTLRWLMQQPGVAAIPKASSAHHRIANFEVFDFELSSEEMLQIFDLARGQRLVNPDWGPNWDEE